MTINFSFEAKLRIVTDFGRLHHKLLFKISCNKEKTCILFSTKRKMLAEYEEKTGKNGKKKLLL